MLSMSEPSVYSVNDDHSDFAKVNLEDVICTELVFVGYRATLIILCNFSYKSFIPVLLVECPVA